jgi:hypothetical protein
VTGGAYDGAEEADNDAHQGFSVLVAALSRRRSLGAAPFTVPAVAENPDVQRSSRAPALELLRRCVGAAPTAPSACGMNSYSYISQHHSQLGSDGLKESDLLRRDSHTANETPVHRTLADERFI